MSVAWKTLSQGVLTGTAAAQYAPATAKQGAIHSAHAWNPGASAATLNVYLVPSGGTATDATHVFQWSVPAGKPLYLAELINLKVTNPSSLYADGNGMTLTITGAEADA